MSTLAMGLLQLIFLKRRAIDGELCGSLIEDVLPRFCGYKIVHKVVESSPSLSLSSSLSTAIISSRLKPLEVRTQARNQPICLRMFSACEQVEISSHSCLDLPKRQGPTSPRPANA